MITLSIIILSWNTKALLRQCLKSLINGLSINGLTNSEIMIEIIVVDNHSTDKSVEMVKKEFPEVRLIINEENLGFARGNNVGLKQASGKYVMLLNSDTIVKEGAIDELIKFFEIQPESVAAISPLVLNEDGSVQKDPVFFKFPSVLRTIIYYNPVLKYLAQRFFPLLIYSTGSFLKVQEIEQLPACAILVRTEIFREVGGLDEEYPHFFEDVDLSFRLRKKGYHLFLDPKAEIIHLGGRSLPSASKNDLAKKYFLNFYSLFLFCDKNYPPLKTFLIKLVVYFQLFITGKFFLMKMLWLKEKER